jgi:phage tail-like protein
MAENKEVYPIDTFKVTLGGAESGGLFNTVSGIGSNIDPTGFDHVDGQGKPQVAKTPAKVNWGDLTCSRGMDKDMKLWQWHYDCIEKGIEGNRKDITVELLDTKGTTVLTWSLTNAWPSSYQAAGQDASGGVVATESVSFTYERLERK